jgi:Ca2+/Na+ antiporter
MRDGTAILAIGATLLPAVTSLSDLAANVAASLCIH